MKATMLATTLIIAAATATAQGGPVKLTENTLDRVTGGSGEPFTALSEAAPSSFTVTNSNGRLDHDEAALRFQPDEEGKGIAIPGGSKANFDRSILRESGDPTFGSVVELY